MNPSSFITLNNSYCALNYNPLPCVLKQGKGVWVWDVQGRRYLDCLSSYSALNQGHCHPKIIKALKAQANLLTLTSRAFYNDKLPLFLEKICHLSGFDKALPMNTGAEAVETAIKIVRKWGYKIKKIPPNKAEIIVCNNNFHGRTTTIISFSTTPQYYEEFGPLTPGFIKIPFGDPEALLRAITPNTVGFLVEPIQGEGGINVPPAGYLKKIFDICKYQQVLLMTDEIQTGLGRTGSLFAYQHEPDVKPDVLILGKALSGGAYPTSCVLTSRAIMDVIKPGDHGSTYGGNPLAVAVSIAALDALLDEKMPQNANKMGTFLMEKLKTFNSPHIQEIRGRGLLIGIEIKKNSGPARRFCEQLMEAGLLTIDTHGQTIRLAPPLILKKTEAQFILQKLNHVLC